MQNLLYATDGSEDAVNAGRFLAFQPFSADMHIHILTVRNPKAPDDSIRILAGAVNALARFPGFVTTATAPAETPTEVIATIDAIATNMGADLIAVGSRGLSTTPDLLLGSVSGGVARTATCPVLIAKAPVAPLDTMVIGVDGSPESLHALHWAIQEIPRPIDSATLIVHAGAPVGDETFAGKDGRNNGLVLAQQIQRKYGIAAECLWQAGEPSTTLIAVAEKRHAGLIVTGVREIPGIERLAHGSVSERLLHHAPCCLLIVKR